ncbi:MAG TPA: patatin-like phospholipase family protein [Chitinophaga sp.]|uniref:patatin-like phospholipase family protein n=1 Tax=Chitinophaga sp. TaxID=1869181 RepID=UPI002BB36E8E|nr:patatin-like phospholipase family protein [Chitinophaga sp.]HVI45597.1 patatin-like phospholipase family protein [Chitinophaga sp.]
MNRRQLFYQGRFLGLLVVGVFIFSAALAQHRPKIGLTLSGGGARGLAHIGILQAIDSAGLKVDYLTGTSMGSIVGGLYAMGYSGDTIETLARRLDWNSLFSNQPDLTDISHEEKNEYNKYIIEIPFEYGKPKLASGVISGEALWLELARLGWPVKDIKRFSDFKIPFKCIATDVATGEIVTLDSGEVVTSMRASMAIPSIFTAVKIGDRKLVDGGVVRNFPVVTAKEMGADIVIGSNVSGGLRKADQLQTPFDILYQLGFYKDAEDFKEARRQCDIYVSINKYLENYSAASFGSVDSILEAGKRRGREMYPVFKHLADSLNALYPPDKPFVANRLPFAADIELSSIHVSGLVHSDPKFFLQRLHLKPGECYSPEQMRNAIRKVFGTRFYKLITYNLIPEGYGKSRMDITAEENPLTYAKFAINYNTFTGASAILNLTQRNFIVPNSRSFVSVAISENPRLQAEYFKYLGRSRDFGFGLSTYYENNGLTYYDENFKMLQPYRTKYFNVNMNLQYSFGRDMAIGAGTRWEYIKYKPQYSPLAEVRGSTNQLNTYVYYGVNSLDRKLYPTRGLWLQVEGGLVYNQHPGISVSQGNQPIDFDSAGIRFNNYQRLVFSSKYYIPFSSKSALELDGNVSWNMNYNESVVNSFIVGGMNYMAHNQVPLIGLYEGEVVTPRIGAVQVAWQYEVIRNVFAIPRAGGAIYDSGVFTNKKKYAYLTGYGLGAGYSSRLGPVEATMMYNDQSGKLKFYVNMGFTF